jgi:PAS domain S-box-containing protein
MDDSRDEELQRLRRCLRDVVAISALPAVWTGYDTPQIVAQVGEVVGRALHADAVYVCASGQESIWSARTGDSEAAAALRESALLQASESTTVGGAAMRLLSSALSVGLEDRIIVAARRAGFPDDNDRLLLRVAANQASTWIQRKSAERALAEESAFRRGIESSMAAGVAAVDSGGRQTYVNRAFANMVGWDASELVGATPPFVYWAPEDSERIAGALRQVMAGNLPAGGFDLRFRRRSEERFDALVLVSPLEGSGSGGYLACVYDVSERRAQERATAFLAEASDILSRSLEYEETLASIGQLAVPQLADWCFVDLAENGGWFRRIVAAHADPADAALAQQFKRRYGPNPTVAGVSNTFANGSTVVVNDVPESFLDRIARDEQHRRSLASLAMRCFVSVPMMSRGATFGVLTFVGTKTRQSFQPRDVELFEEVGRRAAIAVDNARLFTEAQAANRAKDEFLANVSHELRTPMTAILGWAHLLHVSDLDTEDLRLGIATIRQSAQAQAKLIDDLLDVSRIVTGKLHLNMSAIDLAAVVQEAAATIRPAAAAKRQDLSVRVDAPLTVNGDAARLQQVLWNLLSNAVKFTPAGGSIALSAERRGAEIVVRVTDSGEGIAPEYLSLVFDRFRQLGKASQARSGLGIGLAIAKELIEMHGGSIRAESAGEHRGASFIVTIPVAPADARPTAQQRERDHLRLRNVRLLLVEDDDTTRTLLTTLLRSFGGNVTAARSADEALALVTDFDPQVVVSDISLPGDDGISLLRKLFTGGYAGPAIAVTAYADSASRERVLAAGFDAFISKPVDPAAFALVVEQALRASRARQVAARSAGAHPE